MKNAGLFLIALLGAVCHADPTDDIRSITDPNARIVEELRQGFMTSDTDSPETIRAKSLDTLSASAKNTPTEVAYFHVLFSQPQPSTDLAAGLAETMTHIDEIVFKQYDPISNHVWTTGVRDLEFYKGSLAARLQFVRERAELNARAVASASADQPAEARMPVIFADDVYEVKGYSSYESMNRFVQSRATEILGIFERQNPTNYQKILDLNRTIDANGGRLDLPNTGRAADISALPEKAL